ncbi:uncharacterized protein LOC127382340 isoform X2 [Apus apus]|uniref:uncharacterized protein LOC127382340 isoform X2 n=1 Tax=Apus apus TaxID=8895 RepID=UPI0021F8A238|nr:uncharacterized protein LOC127382340 isoform X2 [Apus apus]
MSAFLLQETNISGMKQIFFVPSACLVTVIQDPAFINYPEPVGRWEAYFQLFKIRNIYCGEMINESQWNGDRRVPTASEVTFKKRVFFNCWSQRKIDMLTSVSTDEQCFNFLEMGYKTSLERHHLCMLRTRPNASLIEGPTASLLLADSRHLVILSCSFSIYRIRG